MRIVIALILALMLFACFNKPYSVKHGAPFTREGFKSLYVVNHGWHTGFVVPADAIQEQVPELIERFGGSEYLEFGWGDREFYQAKEITIGLALQAIFLPTSSVVHVVAVPENVNAFFQYSEVEKLNLNESELNSLVKFISGSLHRNDNGIVKLKTGIYGDSQFYQGVGDYYLMNTCNRWTAKGLKSIGMDISPMFKFTASSIMEHLRDQRRL